MSQQEEEASCESVAEGLREKKIPSFLNYCSTIIIHH